MSYTKGPWTVVNRRQQEWDIDSGSEKILGYQEWEGLATVYGSDDNPTMGSIVGQANAHLIAAAPDMYEALENLLAVCRYKLDRNRTPAMGAAVRALAKARGQA